MKHQVLTALFAAIVITAVALPAPNLEAKEKRQFEPTECTEVGQECNIIVSHLFSMSLCTVHTFRYSITGY